MKSTLAALFVLALAACGTSSAPGARSDRPSVLLIVVDSLRKDHMSCYGYPQETSPQLDRLAAESVRYDHAVSAAPWTLPSVSALLTSKAPSVLGVNTKKSVLQRTHRLLPEVLKEAGYRTGAVVSHKFVAGQWGFDQGFDLFDETNVLGHRGISSPGITEKALEFLDAFGNEPFFLFLHYFDPHFDYVSHAGLEFPAPAMEGERAAEFKVPDKIARYDSEIAWTDRHIGEVLDHLRDRGLFDDTLIVFVADHGEEFLDHDDLGHTKTLYRELLDVPLLIKFPHGIPGVVSEPVASVDVFPTVLATLGLPLPEGLAGRPLSPEASEPADRRIFSETSEERTLRGLTVGPLKVIKDLETGAVVGYDRSSDPLEEHPLPADDPRIAPLAAELERWIANLPEVEVEETTLTPEQELELQKLGYGGEE